MFNKKNSALLLAAGALVAGGLASCGGGNDGPSLSIWCPGTDESVINAIVASFKETYEDYADWNIYIDQTIGEGDTQAPLVQDKTASADIICMADDNLRTAVQSNTVLPVDAADVAAIAESDGQDAVDSLSINGTLYGYPYRMDNSYLLFYDTTIYSQEDIKSLDSILKKSQEAGVDFCFDLATGWYSPSVFMANDVYQWIDQDQDGVDTILSEYYTQAGVDVAEALWKLSETYTNNGWNWTADQGVIEGGVKEGSDTPVGAAILWNDYNILKANNPNIAVAPLPAITVNGEAKPLHTFQSYKALIINNNVESKGEETVEAAKALCRFWTNATNQERYLDLDYGVSNISVMEKADTTNMPFVQALDTMIEEGRTYAQAPHVTGNFWTPMQNLMTCIKNLDWGAFSGAKEAIRNMINSTGWTTYSFDDAPERPADLI